MSVAGRRRGWGIALLAAMVLVWFAPTPEPELIASQVPRSALPVTSTSSTAGPRAEPSSLSVLRIVARDDASAEETDGRLFGAVEEPPPVAKEPVLISKPIAATRAAAAPALPFILLGRYDDAQRSAVYLQYGSENLVVQAGDRIGSEYRVESLQGSSMVLRYLPANVLQTMDVGGAR